MSYPRSRTVNLCRITSRGRGVAALAAGLSLVAAPAAALASSGGSGLSGSSASAAQSADRNHRYPGDSAHLGDRVLKYGMSGRDVGTLQKYLTKDGFSVPATGTFGSRTKSRVIAFEKAEGYHPNGVVSWSVQAALRDAIGAPPNITRYTDPTQPTATPTAKARIVHGLAVAPANAPQVVKNVIAAGNKIAFKPYIYGGGHGSFHDSGYDCSGSVSYALHGGGLISSPDDSSGLESYGSAGAGRWITLWSNSGHVYMYVAGLRFDTSAQGETGGSRWTTQRRSNSGFVERHPTGY